MPLEGAELPMIGSPTPADWSVFQDWAGAEGWRVPPRELAIYRCELADSAFVARNSAGVPLGFVTVSRHRGSGWIGNLIVDPARRGQGLGRRLFMHAVDTLSGRGAESLWLTASEDGRLLYASSGFREIGRIQRWVWRGPGRGDESLSSAAESEVLDLIRADAVAWGHSRAELLDLLARGGRMLASGATVALLQPGDGLRILGPWLSTGLCPRENRQVLAAALEACSAGGELVVDLYGGSPVRMLLAASGFSPGGETVLMARGDTGAVNFARIVALASLGSMG